MKNNKLILSIMAIVALILLFIIYRFQFSYKVGILYSQNDISGYNEKQLENSDLITRKKAIEIATHIVKDIIGIDVTDGNPIMNVNIYKNNNVDGTYNWNISWLKESSIETYGVVLNAHTGEISDVYVNYIFEDEYPNDTLKLTHDEVIDIIRPFTDYIKVNIDNYNLIVLYIKDYYVNEVKSSYQYCLFNNEKNNEEFFVKIDLKSKKIIAYGKLLEGTINETIGSGR